MRRLALLGSVALLAAIWLGPLLADWRDSFAAYMLAHMGVVALAAPLLALALSPGRARQEDPRSPSAFGSLALVASLFELVVVWGWHAPAARAWAEASTAATVLEQASFLVAGLFLWLACLRPGRETAGACGLLLTSVHMTLLGALLALSPRPLYGAGSVTCVGLTLTADQDQQLGGVIMLMTGAAVYLAGGLWLLSRVLSGDSRLTGAVR